MRPILAQRTGCPESEEKLSIFAWPQGKMKQADEQEMDRITPLLGKWRRKPPSVTCSASTMTLSISDASVWKQCCFVACPHACVHAEKNMQTVAAEANMPQQRPLPFGRPLIQENNNISDWLIWDCLIFGKKKQLKKSYYDCSCCCFSHVFFTVNLK